jgi:hypothetical protein
MNDNYPTKHQYSPPIPIKVNLDRRTLECAKCEADHLAALAEKEREILWLKEVIEKYQAHKEAAMECRKFERDELQEQIAALQAEANRNMEELCRARAEKKDEYCQGCALPGRMKELEETLEKIYWEISDRLWSHS